MTNRRSHERLIRPEHRWPADRSNPVYRHLGDWWNNAPLVEEAFGGRLDDLESLRRASQHLQADGLRYAIEANRRRAPRQSGSIPWQLFESYPNAWCTAAVDHRGDPKPAFRAVARAFAPLIVCARLPAFALDGRRELELPIWVCDDTAAGTVVDVRRRIVDLHGAVLAEATGDLHSEASPDTGLAFVRSVDVPDLVRLSSLPALVFVDLEAAGGDGSVLATNRYLLAGGADFGPMRDVPPASVEASLVPDPTDPDRGVLELVHCAGPAALGIRIEDDRPIDDAGWLEAADDAFDLLPGERRPIPFVWTHVTTGPRSIRLSGWNVEQRVLG
jgi:beta-mannosidase